MAQTPSFAVADSLYHAGRFSEAIKMSEQLAAEAEASEDGFECLRAWCLIGECYFELGDIENAKDYCCRSYVKCAKDKFMRSIPDVQFLSASLSATAKIYKANGEYEEAMKYLRRCISIDKALERGSTVALRYGELAEILIAQGRYDEALAATNIARTYTKDEDSRILSLQSYNTGLCMEALGDSVAAEKCFMEASERAFANGRGDNLFGPLYLLKLASYALARGDREEAEEIYKRITGFDTSKVVDMTPYYEVYKALADLYKGEDDALSAICAAKADSLSFYPELRTLVDKLALYNVDFPRKEREQVIANQRLRLWFATSVILLIIVILIILFSRYKDLQEISRMREEQNETLRLANEQKDQLLEISKAIADEHVRDEVSRIASELGDVAGVKLTKRESEIAALIADGLLNKEIADHLNISVRTVEYHRNAIYRKFGINNAVELMKYLKEIKK